MEEKEERGNKGERKRERRKKRNRRQGMEWRDDRGKSREERRGRKMCYWDYDTQISFVLVSWLGVSGWCLKVVTGARRDMQFFRTQSVFVLPLLRVCLENM